MRVSKNINIFENNKKKKIVQEAWMIFSGKVRIYLYDLDEKLLLTKILKPEIFRLLFQVLIKWFHLPIIPGFMNLKLAHMKVKKGFNLLRLKNKNIF